MTWTTTGVAPDVEGDLVPATVAGAALVLVRLTEGWSAVEDRCSHAGCPFSTDATLEDERIVCECHGSEFDPRTGAVLRPPARRPVSVSPTRIGPDGRLEVDR